MTIDNIKWTAEKLRENIAEAKEYMHKANAWHDGNRAAADWCKDMAQTHMQSNTAGFGLLKKQMDEFLTDEKNAVFAPGVKAVFMAIHGDMLKEAAEVRAMIDTYGK